MADNELKREIRDDIAELVGMKDIEEVGYEMPETGDKKFNKDQLEIIIYYFDELEPKRSKSYGLGCKTASLCSYTGIIKDMVKEVTGEGISTHTPGKSWSGYRKDELVKIREAIQQYEPLDIPDIDELVEEIQKQAVGLSDSGAKKEAQRVINRRKRYKGKIHIGFTVEDIDVKIMNSVNVNDEKSLTL